VTGVLVYWSVGCNILLKGMGSECMWRGRSEEDGVGNICTFLGDRRWRFVISSRGQEDIAMETAMLIEAPWGQP